MLMSNNLELDKRGSNPTNIKNLGFYLGELFVFC
jgi:hypothetical protein